MVSSWFSGLISRTIERVEAIQQPALHWLLIFIFVVTLRIYLEDALTHSGSLSFIAQNNVHEVLFYLAAFGTAAVVLSFGARVAPDRVLRVLVAFSPIILLPPLIDIIVSRGGGLQLTYITNFNTQGLLARFLTLGGEWRGGGATPGAKVEAVFILAGIATYIWVHTKQAIRTVFSTFVFYCSLVAIAVLPVWVRAFGRLFNSPFDKYQVPGSKLLLILCFILGVALLYRWPYGRILLRSLRLSRIIIYLAFLVVGVVYSVQVWGVNLPMPNLVLNAVLVALAVVASSVFVMVVNDQEDIAIDRVSNPNRPLPSGSIPLSVYRACGNGTLAFAGIAAAAAGALPFLLILLGNGLYVAYSAPPFKLKRWFILGKASVGIGVLVVMSAGFLLNTTRCSNIMPVRTIIAVFLAVFVAAFAIDLKDVAGDRLAGLPTLPVKLGEKLARFITALLIFIVFSIIPFILSVRSGFIGAVILGIVTSTSLFFRPYREWVTFACFVITLGYFSALVLGVL